MMDDLDIQLSQEHIGGEPLIHQQEFVPDLMLQPITTQDKFNKSNNKRIKPKKSIHENQDLNLQTPALQQQHNAQLFDNQNPTFQLQQSKKFRQYLNQKVVQLKKSQQIKNKSPQKQLRIEEKNNLLRKIIQKEHAKNQQNQKNKLQSTNQKFNSLKGINDAKRTIQPSQTSNQMYKDTKNNKIDKVEKRFSNSHSNLVKNGSSSKKQDPNQSKKSIELNMNSKTPKLPNITTQSANPAFPSKNALKNLQEIKPFAKNIASNEKEKHEKKSSQTTNSFRIKKTSNMIPPTSVTQKQINGKKSSQQSIQQMSHNQNSQKNLNAKPAQRKQPEKQTLIKSNKSISKQSPVIQSNNKKMREQFMRLNEEQKILQQQIFKHHHDTKKMLDNKLKKFHLSAQAYEKYGIKKNSELIPSHETRNQNHQSHKNMSLSKVNADQHLSRSQEKKQDENKRNQSPLKKERKYNSSLDQELNKINNLLKTKTKQIQKAESRVQRNPYIVFLRQTPQDKMAQIAQNEQDQQDQVNQLPKYSNIDQSKFGSTYGTVMTQMKDKKWGLKQRITFQTHRDQNSLSKISKFKQPKQKPSNFNNNHSTIPEQQPQDPTTNKIQVNSRLKNLLLD